MGEIINGIAIGGAVLGTFAFITSILSLMIANTSDIADCIMNVSPDPNAWLNIYGIVSIVVGFLMMIVREGIACCNKDVAAHVIAIIGIVYYLFYIVYCSIGAKLALGDLIDCINDGNPVAVMILVDVIFYLIVILFSLLLFLGLVIVKVVNKV